jgi:hypothetical protein
MDPCVVAPRHRVSSLVVRPSGDGFFVFQVLEYRFKGWVNQMLVPYFFFFATACLVSLYSVVIKVKVRAPMMTLGGRVVLGRGKG